MTMITNEKTYQEYAEELYFIGCLMANPEAFPTFVPEVELEYFQNDLIRKFWKVATIVHKELGTFNWMMVLNRMYSPEERTRDFPNEYHDLTQMLLWAEINIVNSQDYEKYFVHLKTQYVKNQLTELNREEVRRMNLGETIEDVQEDTMSRKHALQRLLQRRNVTPLDLAHENTFNSMIEAIKKGMEGQVYPQYGYSVLDEVTYGIQPTQFVVLGAQQGTGKSVFALNFGLNMAKQGFSVLYVSLEMGEDQMMKRVWSCLGGIPYGRLMSYQRDDMLITKINRFKEQFDQLDFDIMCEGGVTVLDIERRLQKKKYDVVIVDYVQLMHGKGSSRYEQITNISNGLKSLAMQYETGILGLAQLSKEGQKSTRPYAHHLKDSSSLEQDAEVIMLLHNPQVSEDYTGGKMVDLFVEKNRNGRSGVKLNVSTDFGTMRVLGAAVAVFD